jgi:tetratricopeptide (TPR) repeat protein
VENLFPMNQDDKHVITMTALLLLSPGVFAQAVPVPAPAERQPKAVKMDYTNLDRGDRAFEDRIYEVALKYYKAYRDNARAWGPDEPDFVHATTKIAETALCLGRVDEASQAIAEFEKSKFPVREDYRDAYLYIKAAVMTAGGQAKEAREQLRQVLPTFTDPIEKNKAILLLGNIGIQLGEWDEATAFFKQIPELAEGAEIRLKVVKAGADLGQLKVELLRGRLDVAGEFIAKLEKNPATDARLVKLYQVLFLLKKNNLNEALTVYRGIENARPLQADFDWWLVANALADELKKAERPADAKTILNQTQLFAITARDKVVAQLRLADNLVSLNDLPGAIAILDRFRLTNPELPELYQAEFRVADLFRAQKEYKQAVLYYGMVVDGVAAPPAARYKAMFNMGLCQRELSEYETSALLFKKTATIAATPVDKAEALMQAAESLLRKRDYAGASQLFAQVAVDNPTLAQGEDARRNEGRVLFDAHRFVEAIQSYDLYLKTYPAGKGRYLETIKIERGIALRESGDLPGALKAFTDFIGEYRNGSPDLPRALEEAYKTALLKGDTAAASRFVSEITDKYANSPYYPQALYWKAHIAFIKGEGFEVAAKAYLQQFDSREEAVDVCFWLADWYNSQNRYAEALSLFIRVKTDHSASLEAPLASYEAAKICNNQGDYAKGISFLDELEKLPNFKSDNKGLRYKCWLLKGDLLLAQQKFDEAVAAFGKAVEEAVVDSRPGWDAKGRLGEALLVKALKSADDTSGLEVEKIFKQALQQFDEALGDKKDMPADIRDTLWLDRAKVLERMGNRDEAFKAYYDIVLAYEEDVVKDKPRDWKVLELAAFEAARLASLRHDYDQADRIYSRIIRMDLPLKKEAKERKEKLLEELRQRDKDDKERLRENGGEPKVN